MGRVADVKDLLMQSDANASKRSCGRRISRQQHMQQPSKKKKTAGKETGRHESAAAESKKDVISHVGFPSTVESVYEFFESVTRGKASPPELSQLNEYELSLEGRAVFFELWRRVQLENPLALAALVHLITTSVRKMTLLAMSRPDLVRPISRTTYLWPSLVSPTAENRKDNVLLMGLLQLAAESEVAVSKKSKWKTKNIASSYALLMVHTIRANQEWVALQKIITKKYPESILPYRLVLPPQWVQDACLLPPLSKSTADAWFKVGLQALMEGTNDHPENLKELRPIGQYRVDKRRRVYPDKPLSSKAIDTELLDGIKNKIRMALRSLAAADVDDSHSNPR